jgi:GDP-D-mannose dehydratase
MTYTNKKALITGVTGQDGAYLAEVLKGDLESPHVSKQADVEVRRP